MKSEEKNKMFSFEEVEKNQKELNLFLSKCKNNFCFICKNIKFKKLSSLKSHININHIKNKLELNKFKIRNKKNELNYKCPKCSKIFRHLGHFSEHYFKKNNCNYKYFEDYKTFKDEIKELKKENTEIKNTLKEVQNTLKKLLELDTNQI